MMLPAIVCRMSTYKMDRNPTKMPDFRKSCMPKCEPSYKSTLELEIKRYIYVCKKSKIDADAKRFLCKKSKRSQQEVFSAALLPSFYTLVTTLLD